MVEDNFRGRPREELAEVLRSLRKAAGLSGERLAVRCAMSQSKISRIERGMTLPSVSEVERILTALDVPGEVCRELVALARRANVDYRSWRAYAQVGLWRKQAELRALAESASMVRQFLPAIPSGLIQTESYAREVMAAVVPGEAARDVERAVRARMESQTALEYESRSFVFLLTEQAVRWRYGSAGLMAAQCEHVAAVAERPDIDIAVIPQSATAECPPLHVFVVYDERLVEIELFSGEIVLREPQEVAYHLNLFDHFLRSALRGDDAVEFLRTVAGEFMREGD
ncbi:helix-turn-helix domain-containing protein [Saccharopolyspora erythraea]|uniref:helix-turn-helix domain-containing protein n=1 Tax=Saccharopolyspora erythraea TaxID=1836 RepID=UPI001BAC3365|nr:helix-turn-helix transcriptional regulator [Saccharopolyspora erythraea]QUH04977.1 helix-turn-helix domain-containing protein [Saccharopolyspora erythraea]